MEPKQVIILGDSHLARRVSYLLTQKGFRVIHIPDLLSSFSAIDRLSIMEAMETAY